MLPQVPSVPPESVLLESTEFVAPPDPGHARTLDGFAEALRNLKTWAGNPSYEAIAGRVNARRPSGEQVGKTTVVDCFRPGRRRLDAELLAAVVEVLHPDLGYVNQWRQALRVISGETRAAAQVRVLDSLPGDEADFIGRATELERLRRPGLGRQPDGETVVISALAGMAGVGKTRLAIHLGHLLQAEKPFDRILFVDLRGFHPDPEQPPADPAAVLEGFLRLVGVQGQHMPHGLAERSTVFRRKLAGLRSLVVLDNAADEQQIAPLLLAVPGCVTLVTSRRDLAVRRAARLTVDVFTPAEALQYLAAAVPHIPVGGDPAAATRIADRCGRLPLALALVAGHMRAKPGWSLTDHADWLDERHADRRLDSGVELALEVSYRNLPPEERKFLRLIALHPGQDFDAAAAAALAGIDRPGAEGWLAELVADHLVLAAAPGRYQLHDLVRAYAVGRSADEDRPADRQAAVTRLLDHYLGSAAVVMNRLDPANAVLRPAVPEPVMPLPDPIEPLSWLEAERTNLIVAVSHAAAERRPRHVIRLAAVLHRFLMGRYNHDCLMVNRHAAEAAEQIGDKTLLAGALTSLAGAELMLGRHESAVRSTERALDILRRTDRRVETARALNNLTIALMRLGRYEQAREHSRAGLALHKAVGERVGEARMQLNLGNIEAGVERHDLAAEHYREALRAYQETGDPAGEAVALGNLGGAEARLGQLDSAQAHLDRAVAMNRALRKPLTEANALDNLGHLMRLRGDGERAAEYHRQALLIFRESGSRDGEACAHNGIGEAAQMLGRPTESADEHRRALAIAEDPDVDDRPEQARAHIGLADASRELGEVAAARQHYRTAQRLWAALGSPRAAEIAARLAELEPSPSS